MQSYSINLEKNHWYLSRCITVFFRMLFIATMSGCSVYMAAHQPDAKNLNVFAIGTPRNLVLAEIGQAQATEIRDGKRVDVFSFVQGYSKGNKASRAIFHGAADVLTVGLWEVVGTPTEASFDGEKMAFEVTYDESDKVEKVVQLIGKNDATQAQQRAGDQAIKPTTTTPARETAKQETSAVTRDNE
jgi:hypothetical protein